MGKRKHGLFVEASDTKVRGRAEEEEVEVEVEVEVTRVMRRACSHVDAGNYEEALSLLESVERLFPNARGLPELVAVAEVCCAAATHNRCACSSQPQLYKILKISEKADLASIKKRYRQLALLLHPDKNKSTRAEEAFKLVSEAYAHLSDKRKRALIDLERLKSRCKECSSVSKVQSENQNLKKHYRECLKGQDQTCFQNWSFNMDFQTAEWKIEHEKLRLFRERVQSKVDSLAHILRERRTRWNEEVAARGKHRTDSNVGRRVSNKGQKCERLQQCIEVGSRISESTEHSHKHNNAKHDSTDSISCKTYPRSSWTTKETKSPDVPDTLVEKFRAREAPKVSQSHDELLGHLLTEMRLHNNTEGVVPTGSNVGEGKGVRQSCKNTSCMEQCQNSTGENHCSSPNEFKEMLKRERIQDGRRNTNNCNLKNSSKHQSISSTIYKDEEKMVINAFLAGLSDCHQRLDEVADWRPERSGPKVLSKSSEPSSEMAAQGICNFGVKNFSRGSQFIYCKQAAGVGNLGSKQERKTTNYCTTTTKGANLMKDTSMEENVLQSQKEKSEHLLKTLERLREETKSVSVALEKIKASVGVGRASSSSASSSSAAAAAEPPPHHLRVAAMFAPLSTAAASVVEAT